MTLTGPLYYTSAEDAFIFYPNNSYLERSSKDYLLIDSLMSISKLQCIKDVDGEIRLTLKDTNDITIYNYRIYETDMHHYRKLCFFFKSILLHVLSTKQPQVLPL